MKRLIILTILIILLIITEVFGFRCIKPAEREELLYFPSGKFLGVISAGFNNMMADFIWIKACVYFGEHHLTDKKYPYLYHILDIQTSLDKRFIPAFTLGGVLLSDDVKRIDLAMNLLDKGMYYNPDSWEIPFVKGFIYYLYERDYQSASKWFVISSLKENSPDMTLSFATWTLSSDKGVEITLELWYRIYKMSKNNIIRQKAIKGIIKVISDQIIKFSEKYGYYPDSIEELYRKDYIPFIPEIREGVFKVSNNEIWIE